MSAREEVLARIRRAHEIASGDRRSYEEIDRDYLTTSDRDRDWLVERLVDRLLDYKALVRHSEPDRLPATIAAALTDRGIASVVVPAGLPDAWLSESTAVSAIDSSEAPLSVDDIDRCAGVVTACTVAVAETGTLILDGSVDQGRRVISLIPDYHLCVVHVDQVVGDVPEALTRLNPIRPLTMISGPSATSDIELNRVEGVHGPRTLEVVIVAAATGNERVAAAIGSEQ